MYSLTINNTALPEAKYMLMSAVRSYQTSIPFYNILTSRVERCDNLYKGIYPVSLLYLHRLESYKITTLHYPFLHNCESLPELRPYQKPVVKELITHYNNCNNLKIPCVVNIQAPCGFGKSETSLWIIGKLRIRTVIIVKTKILVNHWCGYFEKYGINYIGSFDGANALISSLVNDMSKIPDVLVVVSRHVENEFFVEFLEKNYSLCLVDEIHSWSLSSNSELSKFIITKPLAVNIYLTATPNSLDVPIYGHIIKAKHPPEFFNLDRRIVNYTKIDNSVVIIDNSTDQDALDEIQGDVIRNSVIVTCILDNLVNCSIVYCNRRRHVDIFFNSIIKSLDNMNGVEDFQNDSILITFSIRGKVYRILKGDAEYSEIHKYIKDLSNYERFTLITTVQFCACGLDLPSVNVIMLALTSIDDNTLKQAVGRAERAPYDKPRKVCIFWVTKSSGSMRALHHVILKTKKVNNYYSKHSQAYHYQYNKFIRDCDNIKNTLQEVGWK